MSKELIEKAKKERVQLNEISVHIGGSSEYYDEVRSWVSENASKDNQLCIF